MGKREILKKEACKFNENNQESVKSSHRFLIGNTRIALRTRLCFFFFIFLLRRVCPTMSMTYSATCSPSLTPAHRLIHTFKGGVCYLRKSGNSYTTFPITLTQCTYFYKPLSMPLILKLTHCNVTFISISYIFILKSVALCINLIIHTKTKRHKIKLKLGERLFNSFFLLNFVFYLFKV